MRKLIVGMLQPIGAFAVENLACDGTPDVCTAVGWIELKVGCWPSRAGSRVRVELRTAQGIWMRRWIRHGGKVWTLTLVDRTATSELRDEAWFLHDAQWSHDHLGNATEEEMKAQAIKWWQGSKPNANELIGSLMPGKRG